MNQNKYFMIMVLGISGLLMINAHNVYADESKDVTIYKCTQDNGSVKFQTAYCQQDSDVEIITMHVKQPDASSADYLSDHLKQVKARAHELVMQERELSNKLAVANAELKTAEALKPVIEVHVNQTVISAPVLHKHPHYGAYINFPHIIAPVLPPRSH